MRLDVESVMIELPQWWYVEWSPLGAFRAAKVEDVHYRNHEACKQRHPVGYEPIGLFPSLESALEHIRELKRMRKEHDAGKETLPGGSCEE